MVENRGFCKSGNKNRMIYQKKHNEISVRNLCGSNTQIWTQTKNKKHQRIKTQQISDQAFIQKNKKQISQKKVLLGFDDKYGNTRLDKTYRFRK